MILDLKQVFITDDYEAPIVYSLDLSDIEFSGVHALCKPVGITGEIVNRAGVVSLKIHCAVSYEAPCDRCGKQTVNDISFDVEHILATKIENEENDDIILVTDMELNLDELCRSDVLLHIPMKHLCKSDCKGLCSQCGKDLNDGVCNCTDSEIDPRLAALAELLK